LIGIRAILDEDQRARFDQMLCGALHPGSPGPSCPPCSEPGMPGAARGAAEGAVSKGMCGGMVAPKR
jgi:glutamate synthase domain-containing protein 3